MSRLALAGEITDRAGLASTVLAAEIGYPGSSIAFAQLLSGMERSGLIEREVRGKRTYRITAAGVASAPVSGSAPGQPGRAPGPEQPGQQAGNPAPPGYDYDELARRLLIQVVRRLASGQERAPDGPADTALGQSVAGLEQELASVRTLHGTLAAENARLREQLRSARRSLALAQDRASGRPVSEQLDAAEMGLLERLLAPPGKTGQREGTGTG